VRLSLARGQEVTLVLFDTSGRRVRERRYHLPAGNPDAEFQLSGIASGVYFLRTTTADGMLGPAQKVCVVR
jgi:hypothetical protein